MEKKAQLYLTLIYEFIFLYVSIMAMALHLYNRDHMDDIDTRTNLGFAIIVGALTMMAFNFVSLFFEIKELINFYKEWKRRRAGVQPVEMVTEVMHRDGKLEETTNNSQFASRDLSQITSVTSVKNNKIHPSTNVSMEDEKAKPSRYFRFDSRTSLTDDGLKTDEDRQGGESGSETPAKTLFKKYTVRDVKDLIQEVPEEFITPQNSHRNYGPTDRITERVLPTSINRLIESGRSESELSSIRFGSERRRNESISSFQDIDAGGQMLNISGSMPLMKARPRNSDEKESEIEDIVQLEGGEKVETKKSQKKGLGFGLAGLGLGWGFGKSSDKKAQRAAKNRNKVVPIFEGGGLNWGSDKKNSNPVSNRTEENEVVRTIVSARGEENDLPWSLAEMRALASARDHYNPVNSEEPVLRRETIQTIPTLLTQQSDTDEMIFNGGLLKLVSEEDIAVENESGIEQIKLRKERSKSIKERAIKKAFTNNSIQKGESEERPNEEERKRSKSKKKNRSKSRGKSVDVDANLSPKPKKKKSRPLGQRVSERTSSSKSRKSTPKKPEWDDRW